jgi:DNA-binding NtrC family response regulator
VIRTLLGAGSQPTARRISALLGPAVDLEAAPDLDAVWDRLSRSDFDVLLMERGLLPDLPRAALESLGGLPDSPAVIVLSESDEATDRAELLAAGALAVLWLGLEDRVLGETLLSLARRQGEHALERLSAERSEKRSSLSEFASASPAMQRFLELARRVVKSDSPLLILGETGVGKERLARSIHSESARASGPFVTVNCGALPESLLESELFGHEEGAFTGAIRSRRGYFELAHRGTILLDEIGEMPLHLQVKLLRVLEDRSIRRVGSERPVEVDVRIVAATNRDLKREMEEGRFRADLFYRLAVVTLMLPPLRERREDIPDLAGTFLSRASRQLGRAARGFHPDAMNALLKHDWPGNVRELINVIERAVLLAPEREIRVSDFRGYESWTVPEAPSLGKSTERVLDRPFADARRELLESFERDYLRDVLSRTGGRIGAAARQAGVTERTLYSMMKRHGLRKEDFKRAVPASTVGSR